MREKAQAFLFHVHPFWELYLQLQQAEKRIVKRFPH